MATILIVDDSGFTRRAIGRILAGGGFDTLEAGDGAEALEVISKEKPDCMVLDLLMPGMDGKDTLGALKLRGISLPVVVLTADIQESTRDDCLKLGASDLLNKPPSKNDLLAAIEKAINSAERVDG